MFLATFLMPRRYFIWSVLHLISRLSVFIVIAWMLSGCVVGQHLKMDHQPSEMKKQQLTTSVGVAVNDDR